MDAAAEKAYMQRQADAENERRAYRYSEARRDWLFNFENRTTVWPMPFPYPERKVTVQPLPDGQPGWRLMDSEDLVASPMVAYGAVAGTLAVRR